MELIEEERANLDSEFKLSKVELNSKIEGLTKKNQKLERLNQALTKDLLSLKYDTSKQIRELQEKLEFSSAQVEQIKASYDQFTEKAAKRQEIKEKEFDNKTREVSGVMRKQLKHKEENANIIKEQYKQIQGIYATRVKEMEKNIELIGNKHVKLENRHKAVLNSFEAEVRVMRDKLAGYERYVNRIKKACYATKYDKQAVRKELENKGEDSLNKPEFKESLNDLEDRIDREREFKEEEYEDNYEGEEFEEDEDLEDSPREEYSPREYEEYPIAEEPSESNFESRRYDPEEEEYEEI